MNEWTHRRFRHPDLIPDSIRIRIVATDSIRDSIRDSIQTKISDTQDPNFNIRIYS